MQNYPYLVFLLCVVGTVFSQTDADLDRKTKASACIYLLKAALFHDGEGYFPRVEKEIEYENAEDLTDKWTEKALINCFASVSLLKSADLIARKKPENISPFAKDNKEILSLRNYRNKYAQDSDKLTKDLNKMRDALKDLVNEVNEVKNMARKYAKDSDNNRRRYKYEEGKRKAQEETQESGFYENGNLNLSMVTKMDPTVKVGIGLGLLAVFAAFFYWGYNTLTKKKENKKQKKK